MALEYEVKTKRSTTLGKDKATLYYPVITGRKLADIRMVAEEISSQTTLSNADVMAVVEAMIKTVPKLLADGYNVRLDNLGIFSVHARAQGREDPAKVTVRDIRELKMSFLPSKLLKRKLQVFKVKKR